ncbi:hypothetical protein PV342_36115 [Streptomyces sp. PA03-3a]|nr:hypothetical protein [Streptomyces sp. PA03-3a]
MAAAVAGDDAGAEGSRRSGALDAVGWLHCFDPTEEGAGDDRSWWWWHAGTDEPGSGWIQVATTGWPFGRGSLSWLIKAGGGTDLAYGP